jgi:uncharacterized membrane protein
VIDSRPARPNPEPPSGRLLRLGIVLPLVLIVVALLLPPRSLTAKASLVGYGICHQMPDHAYQPGGTPLPLCARCSGTFLGAILAMGFIVLSGRGRASGLAPVPVLVALVLFFLIWAADGLNSFAGDLPWLPQIYQPSNLLRLITGTLNGLTLGVLLHTLTAFTLWSELDGRLQIASLGSFGLLSFLSAGLVALIASEAAGLFFPLAVASGLAVLFVLAVLDGLILMLVLGRANTLAAFYPGALPYLLWGGVMAISQLAIIGFARAWLSATMGVPI